jgi:hypothetical protein
MTTVGSIVAKRAQRPGSQTNSVPIGSLPIGARALHLELIKRSEATYLVIIQRRRCLWSR